MKEAEYRKLKERILAEYKAKLGALEMVWEMSRGDATGEPAQQKPGVDSVKIAEIVRQAVEAQVGEFTVNEVARSVQEQHPGMAVAKTSISKNLKRLEDKKVIDLVRRGVGRASTVYCNSMGF